MTVRQCKQLMLFACLLIAVTLGLEVYLDVTRHGGDLDYIQIAIPGLFLVMLASIWRRYARLEAEHGPDYVVPSTLNSRPVLVVAALVALVLAAVAGYLIVTRR